MDVTYDDKVELKKLFIYLEKEREAGRGRERGSERESQADSVLSAQSHTWGSNSQTMRS